MNRVPGAEPAQLKPQREAEGKSTSRSQSTVRHVYKRKSNYEIKDVRAA